jgi:hypothetical protein
MKNSAEILQHRKLEKDAKDAAFAARGRENFVLMPD